LINVADKKMVFENTFSGETRGKNLRENSWRKIGKLALSLKDKQFSESISVLPSARSWNRPPTNLFSL